MSVSGPITAGARVGEFTLERELGRGTMGVVFAARGPRGEPVALKVLAPSPLLPSDAAAALHARFLREARALAAVRHPNVVRVHAAGEDAGLLYLAMDLLEGETLRRRLDRRGALPPHEVIRVGVQLCAALEAVHAAGIVHRDVKPENILVLADDTIRLTDFGIVWVADEATLTHTGGLLGSPAYMAPEQLLGQGADRRSDLYAVAVTLFQLLAAELPFSGESLPELAHNVVYAAPGPLPAAVPGALRRAIQRGLERHPAARYLDAREFALALDVCTQPAPVVPELVLTATTTWAPGASPDAPAHPSTAVVPSCGRHPHRAAVGRCEACAQPLCGGCARTVQPPYLCPIHRPASVLGVPLVRMEVAAAVVVFLLLLVCLSPWGRAWFHTGPVLQ